MKLLITGNSGSGKSTLLPEFAKHGFTTYNTDDVPGICRLENQQTGEPVDWPDGYIDWSVYAWRWQAESLRTLLDSAANVAIAAVMANQRDFYDWFDLRFALTVDNDTLAKHWRGSSDHHKDHHPQNLERALARNKIKEQQFIDDGCIPIAGGRPVAEMTQEILDVIHEHTGLAF